MEMYEAGWTSDLGIIALRKWSLDGKAAQRGRSSKDMGDVGEGNRAGACADTDTNADADANTGDSGNGSGSGSDDKEGDRRVNGIIGVGGWLKDGKEVDGMDKSTF